MTAPRREFLPFGQPNLGAEEVAAVARVLRTGWIGMGPETQQFEHELACAVGARQVVSVNSCTSALFLSLLASGVEPGDEVICPSFTWCSTANAALYLGARPVFCDISPETFNATPASIRAKLSERTRAVIVVHMGGLAADVEGIRRVLPRRVRLIEDAAHALHATYADGSAVGSSGNLVCFSFYANKNLATGEGGAIALNAVKTADRLRSLRLHGLSADAWKRHSHPVRPARLRIREVGYKMNYTDLQAAIGRVQLRRQPEFARVRQAIARHYQAWLAESDFGITAQHGLTEDHHARHLFQIVLPKRFRGARRDALIATLRQRQVGASVHYYPVHGFRAYREYRSGELGVTAEIASRVMTLPIGARMTVADARFVTDELRRAIERA